MNAPSVWRAPDLSLRWWPVFLRNLLVWRKLAIPSLVGNIAEPLMWLVAFGYGMGALVGSVRIGGETVPYILFLASGSICSGAPPCGGSRTTAANSRSSRELSGCRARSRHCASTSKAPVGAAVPIPML